MGKETCFCCSDKAEITKITIGTIDYNLCDECLKEYEDAKKEIDTLRK